MCVCHAYFCCAPWIVCCICFAILFSATTKVIWTEIGRATSIYTVQMQLCLTIVFFIVWISSEIQVLVCFTVERLSTHSLRQLSIKTTLKIEY